METNPHPRRHISKACEGCRQQKIKCNGESPCKRCSRLSLTCVVREVTRQRQQRDDASDAIMQTALRPVRIRNEMTGSGAPRTAVYGPTSTVAVLYLISSRKSGYTALPEAANVTNSSLSLETFNYHLFTLGITPGSSLPLGPAVLTPPLCLTTIPKQLLEFFLNRYINTAWGTVPIQSPAQLTSLLQSSCSAFSRNAQPPTFYPVLLYQLAMGSLLTRHEEFSEMLVMESSLFVSTAGGLTEEMKLQLVYYSEVGNFDKAYEILGYAQGIICTAGYHLDPQAQTPGVKRLLQTLLSLDTLVYVCIAVGRPSLLTPTICLSSNDIDINCPVSKFVSGLFDIINNTLRAQQHPDMSFERLWESAWTTHNKLVSFWAENQPALQFAHADSGAPRGVAGEMGLHVILHQYAILTNFRPFLLYLGYRSIVGEKDDNISPRSKASQELELEPSAGATSVSQRNNDSKETETRLSAISDYIYTSALTIISTLSEIRRNGSLLKDLPMNSYFLETACISLICHGLWHGTQSAVQIWDALDKGLQCMEALQHQKVTLMRLAAVRSAIEQSGLQRLG
ncbi:hypothetical protein BDW72DRAFT_211800 [Aspergillus terricola var. indicus]